VRLLLELESDLRPPGEDYWHRKQLKGLPLKGKKYNGTDNQIFLASDFLNKTLTNEFYRISL
jgi:hypothetical protein